MDNGALNKVQCEIDRLAKINPALTNIGHSWFLALKDEFCQPYFKTVWHCKCLIWIYDDFFCFSLVILLKKNANLLLFFRRKMKFIVGLNIAKLVKYEYISSNYCFIIYSFLFFVGQSYYLGSSKYLLVFFLTNN